MKVIRLKKVLAISLAATMMVSMVTGCGGNGSSASDGAPTTTGSAAADGAAKTVVTVWARDSTAKAIKSMASKFNAQSDTIEVKVTEQPSGQFSDQFSLALSANEAPDIASIDCTKVPYFASIGAFVDITDKYNQLDFKDTFSEGMLALGAYDGKQFALPFAPDVSVLLYNKAHYKEVGLDPEKGPTTWDELIEYSRKLTTNDHFGYVYAGGDAGGHMFTFMPYVWNNGGEVISADGKSCQLGSANAIEALSMLNDLTSKYKVTPPSVTTYSWSEAQDAFLTQKSSQIVLGSAAIYSFVNGENSDLEWGACLLPKGPSGTEYASFSGGDSIGITTQCKNPEAAWEFIKFGYTEDVQVEDMAKNGMLPPRSDMFDNEYFNKTPEYQVLKEALKVGHAPYSLKYDEMYVPVLEAMQRCLNGEKTPEQAFQDAAVAIDKIMK